MQLLTASKLSTVAMLAMAAVLVHSPVSGVPMEQPALVEEVAPTVRAPPNYDLYKSSAARQPSQKAIEDMRTIFETLLPPDEDYGLSFFGNEPQPASPPPGNVNQVDINRVNLKQMKEAAHADQRQFDLVEKRLPQLTQELTTRLDEAWNLLNSHVKSLKMTEEQQREFVSASSAWEEIVQDVFDLDQLEECPYDLLPYSQRLDEPGQRLHGRNPSEKDLLTMVQRSASEYNAYVRHNVCRLVVNGAYPWLLNISSTRLKYLYKEILSVLGQLRLFTPDKAFAHDLDELLKLFAAIIKAHEKYVAIPTEITHLLMLSTPEVVSALVCDPMDMINALLLYLVAKQHEEGGDTHLDGDERNLLKTFEIRDINDTVYYYYLPRELVDHLPVYIYKLTNDVFKRDDPSLVRSLRVVNNFLDNPSMGLEINQETRRLKFTFGDKLNIYPSEMLVNVFDLDQFVNLYRIMPDESKGLSLIVMAGRSRQGPTIMEHVLHDVLGEGKGIKDGVQVDGHPLTATHLALLVQGCAIACTKENWHAFVDLFVKKVRDTEQLSGDDASSTTIAQQVADKISECVKDLGRRLNRYNSKDEDEGTQEIIKAVKEVMNLMSEVGNRLSNVDYHPISGTKRAVQT